MDSRWHDPFWDRHDPWHRDPFWDHDPFWWKYPNRGPFGWRWGGFEAPQQAPQQAPMQAHMQHTSSTVAKRYTLTIFWPNGKDIKIENITRIESSNDTTVQWEDPTTKTLKKISGIQFYLEEAADES